MYLRSSNIPHSILATVLCKRNVATWTQIPCFGVALDSSGTTWYGSANHTQPGPPETRWHRSYHVVYKGHFCWTTWYCSANHSCSDVNKMAAPISRSSSTQYCFCFQTFEGIWNNYVDIEQKVMQVIFIIFLSTWGYNSLGYPTRQQKMTKMKWQLLPIFIDLAWIK